MKNKLGDLRDHLFATIEGLLDPDKPMETDRARAVATVAQTVIDSAKVEVAFLKQVDGAKPSQFLIGDGNGKPALEHKP